MYIDDGLYTGSRVRKDLSELIYMMEPESTLDATQKGEIISYVYAKDIELNKKIFS